MTLPYLSISRKVRIKTLSNAGQISVIAASNNLKKIAWVRSLSLVVQMLPLEHHPIIRRKSTQ